MSLSSPVWSARTRNESFRSQGIPGSGRRRGSWRIQVSRLSQGTKYMPFLVPDPALSSFLTGLHAAVSGKQPWLVDSIINDCIGRAVKSDSNNERVVLGV